MSECTIENLTLEQTAFFSYDFLRAKIARPTFFVADVTNGILSPKCSRITPGSYTDPLRCYDHRQSLVDTRIIAKSLVEIIYMCFTLCNQRLHIHWKNIWGRFRGNLLSTVRALSWRSDDVTCAYYPS